MIVGDELVGKSKLLYAYHEDKFSENYEPSVLDMYKVSRKIEGKDYGLDIWDTCADPSLN